jgi:predicted RNA-binding protein with TRAM domain
MELPEQLQCLFSARVTEQDGSYIVEVPKRELDVGTITEDSTYRVAVLSSTKNTDDTGKTQRTGSEQEHNFPEPPVAENERREVEIENIGDQGDGIARVERGFVIIVPDAQTGERVTVEITDVQQNVAFAEVQERQTHF